MLAFKHPEALFSVLKITSDHSLRMTDVPCKGHLQLSGRTAGAPSHFAPLGLAVGPLVHGPCLCPAGRQTTPMAPLPSAFSGAPRGRGVSLPNRTRRWCFMDGSFGIVPPSKTVARCLVPKCSKPTSLGTEVSAVRWVFLHPGAQEKASGNLPGLFPLEQAPS